MSGLTYEIAAAMVGQREGVRLCRKTRLTRKFNHYEGRLSLWAYHVEYAGISILEYHCLYRNGRFEDHTFASLNEDLKAGSITRINNYTRDFGFRLFLRGQDAYIRRGRSEVLFSTRMRLDNFGWAERLAHRLFMSRYRISGRLPREAFNLCQLVLGEKDLAAAWGLVDWIEDAADDEALETIRGEN